MSRRTGPGLAVRDCVYARDRFACVLCGDRDGAFALHHRRPRGAGGTRRANANSPANLVLLCNDCHAHTESHRADALDRGLLLPQSVEDPSTAPVVWHGKTVLLHDDGSVEDVTPGWSS